MLAARIDIVDKPNGLRPTCRQSIFAVKSTIFHRQTLVVIRLFFAWRKFGHGGNHCAISRKGDVFHRHLPDGSRFVPVRHVARQQERKFRLTISDDDLPALKAKVGICFAEFAVFNELSRRRGDVLDNVAHKNVKIFIDEIFVPAFQPAQRKLFHRSLPPTDTKIYLTDFAAANILS